MAKLIYLAPEEKSKKKVHKSKTLFYRKLAYLSLSLNFVLLLKIIINNLV